MGRLTATRAKMEELASIEPLPTNARRGRIPAVLYRPRLHRHATPYDEIQWETRTATIGDHKGSVIFEQRDIEVPVDWSQTATNIVASKYFHGKLGSPERERSVGELVHRVVDTIADWGIKDGYFATAADGENFRNELAHLMLHQKAALIRPSGSTSASRNPAATAGSTTQPKRIKKLTSEAKPQCSACFIVSVKDSLESILDLAKTEGMLFKWGRAPAPTSRPCAKKTPSSPAADAPPVRSRS